MAAYEGRHGRSSFCCWLTGKGVLFSVLLYQMEMREFKREGVRVMKSELRYWLLMVVPLLVGLMGAVFVFVRTGWPFVG